MDIQRARLLASTFSVLSERGAGGTSVAHIVARSGVSRRTFYDLFDSREDCYLTAFEEAVALASARVLPAYASRGKWQARVRAALVALLGFLDQEPAIGRTLVVESLSAGAETLARRGEVLARVAQALDEGREQATTAGSPPPLTADALVGGALSLIYARMMGGDRAPLLDLTNQLMSMIVLPYLGSAAARRELERPLDPAIARESLPGRTSDPFKSAGMRLTYRTVQALLAVAEHPNASNRTIGELAGVKDQGQTSKLLRRLQRLELVANAGSGSADGGANAWSLTSAGRALIKSFQNHVVDGERGGDQ